jgi:urease accessory protein
MRTLASNSLINISPFDNSSRNFPLNDSIYPLVGFAHGLFNGVALKEGPAVLGLIGIMATLFVLVALVSAFTISLKQPWMRIVVRVAGSWVAAIGMLMFGWLINGQG